MYDSWQKLLELMPTEIVSSKQHVKMEFLWLEQLSRKLQVAHCKLRKTDNISGQKGHADDTGLS